MSTSKNGHGYERPEWAATQAAEAARDERFDALQARFAAAEARLAALEAGRLRTPEAARG